MVPNSNPFGHHPSISDAYVEISRIDKVPSWLLSLVTGPQLTVLWYGGTIGGSEENGDIRRVK